MEGTREDTHAKLHEQPDATEVERSGAPKLVQVLNRGHMLEVKLSRGAGRVAHVAAEGRGAVGG